MGRASFWEISSPWPERTVGGEMIKWKREKGEKLN
jgi:hypothetical protein